MKSIKLTLKISLYILILFIGLPHHILTAQGLLFNDSSYRRIPVLPDYGDGGKAENALISLNPKVDLRPYCPHPGRQGNAFSCTGWALGYGAMSISASIVNDLKDLTDSITKQAFSSLFIYNQIKNQNADCLTGTFISDGLKFLEDTGNIASIEFDADRNDCTKKPTAAQLAEARKNRIRDYIRLFDTDAPERVKIEKTKLCLINQQVVVIGMPIRQNIQNVTPDNKYWLPFIGDTTPIGGHAMVVIGYDDGKGAFEVMNSWGEGWGNNGFFWIRYYDYARLVWYGFQLTLSSQTVAPDKPLIKVKPPQDKRIGNIDLLKFSGWKDDKPQFSAVKFAQPQAGIFTPENIPWHLGQWFQVVVHDITPGSYLYVFSIDGKDNIRVHWPRDDHLDDRFDGLNESAIIAVSGLQLVIPNDTTVLQLEEKGMEYLCLLFGKFPIRDLNQKIKYLKSAGGDFPQKANKILAPFRIPFNAITFTKDSGIHFETSGESGDFVQVLIKIPVE